MYQFIVNKANYDWGVQFHVMEKNGKGFGEAYHHHDEKESIVLQGLIVDDDARKNGLGTELQLFRENIGRELGFKQSCLWVYKGEWMQEWYMRRGYKPYRDDVINDRQVVWMSKQL